MKITKNSKILIGAIAAGAIGLLLLSKQSTSGSTTTTTTTPPTCPSSDVQAVNGVCPSGYTADPNNTGCCMPVSTTKTANLSLTVNGSQGSQALNVGQQCTFVLNDSNAPNATATLYAVTNSGVQAQWNVTLNSSGSGSITLIPSDVSTNSMNYYFTDQNGTSNILSVTINTSGTSSLSYIGLSSNTSSGCGDVTFSINTNPATFSANVTLGAYVNGIQKGVWTIPVTNGSGSITLAPSVISSTVQWRATYNGMSSNQITTICSQTSTTSKTNGLTSLPIRISPIKTITMPILYQTEKKSIL
ncbi:MAG: hypothetical protein QXL94_06845 [Candidatus Parvarchaeum sp.]